MEVELAIKFKKNYFVLVVPGLLLLHGLSLVVCLAFSSRWRLCRGVEVLGHLGVSLCSMGAQNCCSSRTPEQKLHSLWSMGLVASRIVRFSWTRDQTHFCIGRRILYHRATREVLH